MPAAGYKCDLRRVVFEVFEEETDLIWISTREATSLDLKERSGILRLEKESRHN
jgi:hypothetical protein